ncbi:Spy/CpxP family protein refolding chaperone [Pseudoduganella sp. OTU4001]|uniref:Spy/CpxP family protein refolding chaperone n=1 Tax=Pseudoduganella sp. OTU4001 TaxID=3043854 RepID=UPI00313D9179
MKKSKLIPLLLAAAMALPVASHAQERMPPAPMGDHGPRGLPFLRGLDLSDSQDEKLFQLMHSQAPYLREQHRAHEKAMRALHEMRNAEKFDDAAATRLAQAAAQAQANITLAHIRTHQKALALLTPEQRAKLDSRPPRGGFHER